MNLLFFLLYFYLILLSVLGFAFYFSHLVGFLKKGVNEGLIAFLFFFLILFFFFFFFFFFNFN